MKYSPSLAYRATEWLIATFTSAPERPMWIMTLSLIGAICVLFKELGL